jgi:nitrogen fixation protein FixH
MTPPTEPRFRISGRHVLLAVIAFFGVIIAVNAYFLVAAYRTFPGQVSETPYEDGVGFNRTVAQRRAQAELGWSATATTTAQGVEVDLRDRAGQPLQGLKVEGVLRRPATQAGQISLKFTEASAGRYVAKAGPGSGAWDLHFVAKGSRAELFEGERRLTWP